MVKDKVNVDLDEGAISPCSFENLVQIERSATSHVSQNEFHCPVLPQMQHKG